jgi:lysophospholipase L1-like esterase
MLARHWFHSRIGKLLTSLCLVFLVLEACLQLLHLLFFSSTAPSLPTTKTGEFRILCLGESTTDASYTNNYPGQLQQLLNHRYPRLKIRVVNRGVSGYTSGQILKKLPVWLQTVRPQLVISMIGINDKFYANTLSSRWLLRGDSSLLKLRTVRLFLLLGSELRRQWRSTPKRASSSENKALERKLRKHFEQLRSRQQNKTRHNNPKALDLILKGYLSILSRADKTRTRNSRQQLSVAPVLVGVVMDTWLALDELWTRLKRPQQALHHLNMARRQHPQAAWFPLALARWHRQNQQPLQASRMQKQGEQILARSVLVQTQRNLRKIRAQVLQSGAVLLAMQYPLRPLAPLKSILGRHPRLRYLSNQSNFQKALQTRTFDALFVDSFAGDFGHATKAGNRLIADNILKALNPLLLRWQKKLHSGPSQK